MMLASCWKQCSGCSMQLAVIGNVSRDILSDHTAVIFLRRQDTLFIYWSPGISVLVVLVSAACYHQARGTRLIEIPGYLLPSSKCCTVSIQQLVVGDKRWNPRSPILRHGSASCQAKIMLTCVSSISSICSTSSQQLVLQEGSSPH